ncbi:hypothetical protein QOT17_020438 [Balamuthia mandrillaris]
MKKCVLEILKCAPNFPIIDALSKEGAFNYMVAKHHGIKPQPYKELLTKLEMGKAFEVSQEYPKQQFNDHPKDNQNSLQKSDEDNDFIEVWLCQFALELLTLPYKGMDKSQLQELCVKKGLAMNGTKSELISRLEVGE